MCRGWSGYRPRFRDGGFGPSIAWFGCRPLQPQWPDRTRDSRNRSTFDDQSNQKPEFAKQVYRDKVLLNATAEVFGTCEFLDEKDVYQKTEDYYLLLKKHKDTGEKACTDWAYWREIEESVREMLRGPDSKQVTFVVIGAPRPRIVLRIGVPEFDKR